MGAHGVVAGSAAAEASEAALPVDLPAALPGRRAVEGTCMQPCTSSTVAEGRSAWVYTELSSHLKLIQSSAPPTSGSLPCNSLYCAQHLARPSLSPVRKFTQRIVDIVAQQSEALLREGLGSQPMFPLCRISVHENHSWLAYL